HQKIYHRTVILKSIQERNGRKQYQCSECDNFSLRINIYSAIRKYTLGRNHTCSYCNKSFSDNMSLINHLRIHTGEKPYQFSNCDKTFSQKIYCIYYLRKHIFAAIVTKIVLRM
ncbi:unnamed protein product, partial [Meganyctiphanes norvegica]